jgi:hypothetical protein
MDIIAARKRSFIFGGIAAAILIGIGIANGVISGDYSDLGTFAILAVFGFTLVSCLFLNNNFIGEMIATIFSWGFVTMPGLIFTLDLDGIIWLLTVKLLFWIIELLLAIAFGLLAIALGAIMSLFVYPFALIKNIKGIE